MGENQAEKKLDTPLGDALKEVMALGVKYKFTFEDMNLLGCRLLAFGEAISLITDVGMYEEYAKRVRGKIKILNETMTKKSFRGNPFG